MPPPDRSSCHVRTHAKRSLALLHQTMIELHNAMIPAMSLPVLFHLKTGSWVCQLDEIFGCAPSLLPCSDVVPADLFVVKILKPNEPKVMQEDFVAAKREEVDGLTWRQFMQMVSMTLIPLDANSWAANLFLHSKNTVRPTKWPWYDTLPRSMETKTSRIWCMTQAVSTPAPIALSSLLPPLCSLGIGATMWRKPVCRASTGWCRTSL